jgi:hypothetical protein
MRVTAALVVLTLGLAGARAAGPDDPTIAVVAADEAFGRVPAGSPVLVVGEKENWARVRILGPAFRDFYGYVRYRDADAGPLRLAEDGRTAWTVGKIDILAPNLNSGGRPGDSWKLLVRVDADQRLTVLQTLQLDRTIVHKVALPENATGWMNLSQLRAAEAEERQRFETMLTAAPERPRAAATGGATTADVIPDILARVEDPVPTVSRPALDPPLGPAPWPVIDTADAREPATGDLGPTGMIPAPAVEFVTIEPADAPGPPAVEPERTEARAAAPRVELVLEDLEQAYERLRREPTETAEVNPLRNLYMALAESSGENPGVARYAEERAEQLLIWSKIQEKRQEIERIRQRIRETSSDAVAARLALERGSSYVAVGTIASSTIYDGDRLPMLLRLQDPGTSRTIAYLRPDGEHDLLGLIGQLVGIVGSRDYDGGLRLNVIRPERVDILTGDIANR